MDGGAGQAGPASLGRGLCSALPPWHLLPIPQMAAAARCLSLLLLCTCVALLLRPPQAAQGAPLEPVYPGDNATPEQMAQYAAELRRYINMLTRPRCVCVRSGEPWPLPLPRLPSAEQARTSGAWVGRDPGELIPAPTASAPTGMERETEWTPWTWTGVLPTQLASGESDIWSRNEGGDRTRAGKPWGWGAVAQGLPSYCLSSQGARRDRPVMPPARLL